MNYFFRSAVISILGPVALMAGLAPYGNLSAISAAEPTSASKTSHAPIPDPPVDGNGDSGFISTPGVFSLYESTQKDNVKPEFKAAEKKAFWWIGFDDTELGSKKASKDRNSRVLVQEFGNVTPAYVFYRADGTYVASITKIFMKQPELNAVLEELRPRLKSKSNFEHIYTASELKPAAISDAVGQALQEDILREFDHQIENGSEYSLVVVSDKNSQTKSVEKTARKAVKKFKPFNRLAVLFVNTRDWLNYSVLNSLEVRGPTDGVTYLVVDRQQKIVGRREAPAASIDELVDFINESSGR